jgi:hypothetical protein
MSRKHRLQARGDRREVTDARDRLVIAGMAPADAERVALQQDVTRVPGNSQGMWSGDHAEAGSGASASENRVIDRAIAKRQRRATRDAKRASAP